MSTRSTAHFIGYEGIDKPEAIIYRHADGYPDGAGLDIYRFFEQVKVECGQDTRFDDASYLAAKYVVFLAGLMAPYSAPSSKDDLSDWDGARARRAEAAKLTPLHFLSVGVLHSDPGDAEYRYIVNCNALDAQGRPTVTCLRLTSDEGEIHPEDATLMAKFADMASEELVGQQLT